MAGWEFISWTTSMYDLYATHILSICFLWTLYNTLLELLTWIGLLHVNTSFSKTEFIVELIVYYLLFLGPSMVGIIRTIPPIILSVLYSHLSNISKILAFQSKMPPKYFSYFLFLSWNLQILFVVDLIFYQLVVLLVGTTFYEYHF